MRHNCIIFYSRFSTIIFGNIQYIDLFFFCFFYLILSYQLFEFYRNHICQQPLFVPFIFIVTLFTPKVSTSVIEMLVLLSVFINATTTTFSFFFIIHINHTQYDLSLVLWLHFIAPRNLTFSLNNRVVFLLLLFYHLLWYSQLPHCRQQIP